MPGTGRHGLICVRLLTYYDEPYQEETKKFFSIPTPATNQRSILSRPGRPVFLPDCACWSWAIARSSWKEARTSKPASRTSREFTGDRSSILIQIMVLAKAGREPFQTANFSPAPRPPRYRRPAPSGNQESLSLRRGRRLCRRHHFSSHRRRALRRKRGPPKSIRLTNQVKPLRLRSRITPP